MKRSKVFVTVIAEVMNISRPHAVHLFEQFLAATKQSAEDYADRLSREEGQELLCALRKNSAEVRQWFLPGGVASRPPTRKAPRRRRPKIAGAFIPYAPLTAPQI